MKRSIVTISDNGTVNVPTNVQMCDFEIAELLGIMVPTIRSNIRAILKTGVATTDLTNGATLVGYNVLPDYHGLDMIVALAFRIQSPKAEFFRKWVLRRMTTVQPQSTPLYVRSSWGNTQLKQISRKIFQLDSYG